MSNIHRISSFITGHTPTHICVKGKKSAQNQIISTMAEELREFLSEQKGQDVHPDEIRGFFSLMFPKLDVTVNINTATNKNICGELIHIFDKNDKIKAYIMELSPQKSLFGKRQTPNNDKRIKINKMSADTLIHEGTHLFQAAIKPEYQIHHTKIKKLLSKDEISTIKSDLEFLFNKYVYLNAEDRYISPLFAKQINKKLKTLANNNDRLHLEFLKIFIREAENEKQACELGIFESEMFNSPFLKRFKWYRNMVKNTVRQDVENATHYGSKIQEMKQSYFALAKKIHDERLASQAKTN